MPIEHCISILGGYVTDMTPIYNTDELRRCPKCGRIAVYRQLTSEFFMIVECLECDYDASYDVLDEEDENIEDIISRN